VFAQHGRIFLEAAPPEAVAENQIGTGAGGPVVLGGEQAPDDGLHAWHLEVVAADEDAGGQLGGRARLVTKAGRIDAAVSDQAVECLHLVAEGGVVGAVPACAGLGTLALRDGMQLLGVLHRQEAHQHAVEQRENRRVGADAESEGEAGDDEEGGRLPQLAKGVAEIGGPIGQVHREHLQR
jgi:hypothetical protein